MSQVLRLWERFNGLRMGTRGRQAAAMLVTQADRAEITRERLATSGHPRADELALLWTRLLQKVT